MRRTASKNSPKPPVWHYFFRSRAQTPKLEGRQHFCAARKKTKHLPIPVDALVQNAPSLIKMSHPLLSWDFWDRCCVAVEDRSIFWKWSASVQNHQKILLWSPGCSTCNKMKFSDEDCKGVEIRQSRVGGAFRARTNRFILEMTSLAASCSFRGFFVACRAEEPTLTFPTNIRVDVLKSWRAEILKVWILWHWLGLQTRANFVAIPQTLGYNDTCHRNTRRESKDTLTETQIVSKHAKSKKYRKKDKSLKRRLN